MYNPVIVVAIIVQIIVSKISRLTGAVIGYLISTGILLWGISVYQQGNQITLFGIPLAEPFFFIACLVWYGLDTVEFISAKKQRAIKLKKDAAVREALKSPLLQEQRVIDFYKTTRDAWASKKLSGLDKSYAKAGKLSYDKFVRAFAPVEGGAFSVLFTRFPPLGGEFLIKYGQTQSSTYSAWFVLTNLRLIQRDGLDNTFKEVNLAEINTFEIKGTTVKSIIFKMKSGQDIELRNLVLSPSQQSLSEAIKLRISV